MLKQRYNVTKYLKIWIWLWYAVYFSGKRTNLKDFLSWKIHLSVIRERWKNRGQVNGETKLLRSVLLKPYCVHETPENLLKLQILFSKFWAQAQNSEFLTTPQVTPMLLVCGPHFEEPRFWKRLSNPMWWRKI